MRLVVAEEEEEEDDRQEHVDSAPVCRNMDCEKGDSLYSHVLDIHVDLLVAIVALDPVEAQHPKKHHQHRKYRRCMAEQETISSLLTWLHSYDLVHDAFDQAKNDAAKGSFVDQFPIVSCSPHPQW